MIGLCTPYKIDNYGTKLQAYAVQEKIKSLGYDCEIVNFDRRSDMRFDKLLKRYANPAFVKSKFKKMKKEHLSTEFRVNKKIRNDAIHSFDRTHLVTTPLIKGYGNLQKMCQKYDAVICGSDQIWLPTTIHNPTTTLEFAPKKCKRIAFAASFGVHSLPEAKKRDYRRFLSNLDSISVREVQGQKIVSELLGKEVPVVLDPTLTVSPKVWKDLAQTGRDFIKNKKYIFCYFLGTNEEHRKAVRRYADDSGLTVVTIPHFKEFVPADEELTDIQLYDVTPCDFVRLIQEADTVCTDSFHATAFSLLNHRNFYTFERFSRDSKESANARIYSLLGQLGLEERILTAETGYNTNCKEIDYLEADRVLDSLRTQTDQYLNASLIEVPKKETGEAGFAFPDENQCCGCSACMAVCPKSCIQMKADTKTGFHYPVSVHPDDCIHCGLCQEVCPDKKPYNLLHSISEPYFAANNNPEILTRSSSGGLFYPIAEMTVRQGGYVCAASYDTDFNVKHIIVNTIDELQKLIGSKYSESDLGGVFHHVKLLLDDDRTLLFCGTPCQVRGLKSYLRKEYKNLITLDLLCYGIQSPIAWRKYKSQFEEDGRNITAINMRDKSVSWQHYSINIQFQSGDPYVADRFTDPYMRSYSKGLFIRPYCYNCSLKAFPRESDFTIGDFWDIDKLLPEENNGRGAGFLLIHSEMGKSMISQLQESETIKLKAIDEMALRKVHPLFCIHARKSKKSARFMKMLSDDTVSFEKAVKACEISLIEKKARQLYKALKQKR